VSALLILRNIVAFLGGIRASVFFVLLLLAIAGGKWWQHKAHVWEGRAGAAQKALVVERADKARILAELADADKAAEQAKAGKAQAEADAAKKLKARDKFWKDRYSHDPAAKAWSEQPIPAGVLDGLR
jgi:hypothetical protein